MSGRHHGGRDSAIPVHLLLAYHGGPVARSTPRGAVPPQSARRGGVPPAAVPVTVPWSTVPDDLRDDAPTLPCGWSVAELESMLRGEVVAPDRAAPELRRMHFSRRMAGALPPDDQGDGPVADSQKSSQELEKEAERLRSTALDRPRDQATALNQLARQADQDAARARRRESRESQEEESKRLAAERRERERGQRPELTAEQKRTRARESGAT